tara:strand:- start:4868 stop:8410 length:3543 start_codon:yes stop_codon:yes gene_type:complete
METSRLKKFAQHARRSLIEQVRSKLKLVLATESQARREHPNTVSDLEKKREELGESQLVEQVAYLWFNRFCALRFMDVNQYNRIMVISPLAGQFQPEILAEAKAGHIDESSVNEPTRKKVFGLLSGSIASRDGQSEAFRLLIVAVCNDLHRIMPYLFERIEDYTELLMPDDLLSGNSILAYTREAMTPEACESVESIGWLYQFYISEKKDEVFEGLKKNKKITPENIPAATQLFTPHWIVRYLVENSLGRLWMLNNPNSKVIELMDYYIQPVEGDEDFLRISSPEKIKICDPACGSGHMLTYAYDLLYAIYMDAGYDSADIPEKILTNNLFGIEIDERAAELAAFALTMKALKGNPQDEGNNRRRFFRNPVRPNICRLEKLTFTDDELDAYVDFAGRDLFTQDLRVTLKEFEEADNFGSLIQPTLKTPEEALAALEAKDVSGQIFLYETHKSVLKALDQADYLSPKYHVVVANPPYMGGKGMNARLSKWAKDNYPDSRSDLFAMFIERNLKLAVKSGFSAMINMQSWMFLSSFEKLRLKSLRLSTISSMIHLGTRAFDSIGGEVVSTTAYVLENRVNAEFKGYYVRLVNGKSEAEKEALLLKTIRYRDNSFFYTASADDFSKIPGSPLAYWLSDHEFRIIETEEPLLSVSDARVGLQTSDNDRFLRNWHEVSQENSFHEAFDLHSAKESRKKWFPCNKGGEFRKWYGNQSYYVNWENDGREIRILSDPSAEKRTYVRNDSYYFRDSVSWCDITTEANSFRRYPAGFIHDAVGHSEFAGDDSWKLCLMAYCNNKFTTKLARLINPTIHFHIGYYQKLPYAKKVWGKESEQRTSRLVDIAKTDWDAFEISWNFKKHPLLSYEYRTNYLNDSYESLLTSWRSMIAETKELEEDNNQQFIDAYRLNNELNPVISLNDVTLTCNPSYRYKLKTNEYEGNKLLRSDTMREFISYAVGCMFGRYSLNKEGLILANQGDTLEDYLKQAPNPTFQPDDDNVIPLIDFDGDWFEDEISERFKQFLKVSFGAEHFAENLAFIEEAIGKDIRKFFLKDFYADHVKRYKKRPIYWLFSSAKGSFNALIYMHRYRPDTVSVVLNDYLREFRTKLEARKASYEQVEISASASQGEKTQAIRAIEKINKVIDEVNDYERDVLYPLASENREIDLDNGVKHNYPLFGKALKKIPGLS